MAKLGIIKEKTKRFPITISEETINIEVYANKWTGEFVDALPEKLADGRQGMGIAEVIAETVASWDLEYDPALDFDSEGRPMVGMVPLDAKVLFTQIPIKILSEIMAGIRNTMSPNEPTSPSSGSF